MFCKLFRSVVRTVKLLDTLAAKLLSLVSLLGGLWTRQRPISWSKNNTPPPPRFIDMTYSPLLLSFSPFAFFPFYLIFVHSSFRLPSFFFFIIPISHSLLYTGTYFFLQIRVRRHSRFEAKWSETEAKFCSLRCEKKCFFRLFRIDAKRRNLKRNENGSKRKQNKKEAKNCHHFLSEAKWSKTEAKNCHPFRF